MAISESSSMAGSGASFFLIVVVVLGGGGGGKEEGGKLLMSVKPSITRYESFCFSVSLFFFPWMESESKDKEFMEIFKMEKRFHGSWH